MIYWPHFVLICCCTPERRNKVPYSLAVSLLMCNHLLITIIFAKMTFLVGTSIEMIWFCRPDGAAGYANIDIEVRRRQKDLNHLQVRRVLRIF